MPVALVLVLDQEYIADVLAAVANSRLRIQTTQVHWQHLPTGAVKPPLSEGEGDPTVAAGSEGPRPAGYSPAAGPGGGGRPMAGSGLKPPPGSGLSAPPRPGEGGSGRPMGGGSGAPPRGVMSPRPMGGAFGPAGGAGAAPTEEEDDPNLVELAVYGIASLYERYPPKAPAADASTTGGPTKP